MNVKSWAFLFRDLLNMGYRFLKIVILPGTNITVLDFMIWGIIAYAVVKGLYTLFH